MRHSPDTANIYHNDSARSLTNSLGNAIDDAKETIRGIKDHDKAHGLERHALAYGEVVR